MKNQLQELERRLFDDDDDEEEEDGRNCSAVSALTTSEWSETVQNLITPKPLPTSPATSSSSSSSTATSFSRSQATPNSSYKQLLMDSATAISEGTIGIAASIIAGLKRALKALAGDLEPCRSWGC